MPRPAVYLCAGTIVIGLAAVDADNNILLLMFGICLGAIVLSCLTAWRTLRRISVVRVSPEMAITGQPLELRYTITNHRAWAGARCLRIVELVEKGFLSHRPEVFLPRLAAQQSASLTVSAVALKRGRIALSAIQVSSGFPFQIVSKTITHFVEDEIVVYPGLGRLHGQIATGREVRDLVGVGTTTARSRGDDEFFGIREYREGDNPRRIHWRRSAASGQLMIREMAGTRDPQLWCVLDTQIDPRRKADSDRLELIISAAATVICDGLEKGLRVGLVCNGDPLLVLPPGGGRHRRTRLLRELALRGPNRTDALLDQLERIAWPARWRGVGIFFSASPFEAEGTLARFLNRNIGPTRAYVPHTTAFDSFFEPPLILRPDDTGRLAK